MIEIVKKHMPLSIATIEGHLHREQQHLQRIESSELISDNKVDIFLSYLNLIQKQIRYHIC